MAKPPNVSRVPATPSSDIRLKGGSGTGLGGQPNRIVVPLNMNSSPATIRKTLNIRLVQGKGEVSKIDMCLKV
jgi:hypothetical protein